MEQRVREEIRRFVQESEENRFPGRGERYFDEPLVGYAAADDPLFAEYKRTIGPFHQTPVNSWRHPERRRRRLRSSAGCSP